MAPTPLFAANFIILGRVITQGYVSVSPMLLAFDYWSSADTIIFCCFVSMIYSSGVNSSYLASSQDIVCLIVQAMGGLSAAHAANTKTSASMVCTSSHILSDVHIIETGREHYAKRNYCSNLCVMSAPVGFSHWNSRPSLSSCNSGLCRFSGWDSLAFAI